MMSNNMDNVKETTKLNPHTYAAVKRGLKLDNGWLNCCIFSKYTISIACEKHLYVGFSQKGNTKIRLITIYFRIFTMKLRDGTF